MSDRVVTVAGAEPAQSGAHSVYYLAEKIFTERLIVCGGPLDIEKVAKGKYYFEFIDSALKELVENPPCDVNTILACSVGYTEEDLFSMRTFCDAHNCVLRRFIDVSDIIRYINNGLDRDKYKITIFRNFSHGMNGSYKFTDYYFNGIAYGYDLIDAFTQLDEFNKLLFTPDKIQLLSANAFEETDSIFWSCNTGSKKEGEKVFAQEWVNLTKGKTYAVVGAVAGDPVLGGRTDYSAVNGDKILENSAKYGAGVAAIDEASRQIYKMEREKAVGGYSKPYPAFRKPTLDWTTPTAHWKLFKQEKPLEYV